MLVFNAASIMTINTTYSTCTVELFSVLAAKVRKYIVPLQPETKNYN